MTKTIDERYADVMRIAADLAADRASLIIERDEAQEYIRELETSREQLRDDFDGAQKRITELKTELEQARTQAAAERAAHETTKAKHQNGTNSHVA